MNENNYSPQPVGGGGDNSVMTVKDWLITLLIMAIPCVGIIMLFVWAFGDGNENRKNFCRAQLIFMLIMMVLSFILSIVAGTIVAAILGSFVNALG